MIKDIAQRLKKIRIAKNLTQTEMASIIGKTLRAVQRYESGERSIDKTIGMVLNYSLGVNLDWLASGEGGMFIDSSLGKGDFSIPIYDVYASAGYGAWVSGEAVIGHYKMPYELIKQELNANPKNLAMLKIKGDSMEPVLKNKDLVAIDLSKKDPSKGIYVARVENDLYVKSITFHKDVVVLSSLNTLYDPIMASYDTFELIGRVIWYSRCI